MKLNGVDIEDTFAEAFSLWYSRILLTAETPQWANVIATELSGNGTSTIACDAECGIECTLPTTKTPDGRPGVCLQFYSPKKKLADAMLHRLAMCALTAPTAAVFNCLPDVPDKIDTGAKLRFFGDGHQSERELDGRTIVVVPVMSGEFLVEKEFGIAKGVAGGNFIIMAQNSGAALNAGESAVGAIRRVSGAITPFPGGVCGSGSKVGSKYKFMVASTNEKYCPTLRGSVDTAMPEGVGSVTEVVIDGTNPEAVAEAMRRGILAASTVPGVMTISAGNYGGKLGEHRFNLHELLNK